MKNSIYVIATIKAKPGKEAETEALFKGLITPTHAEPGCVRYALHKRVDKPGTLYFVEEWKSQADLDRHLGSAHIQNVVAKKDALIAELEIATVEPLTGGDLSKGCLF